MYRALLIGDHEAFRHYTEIFMSSGSDERWHVLSNIFANGDPMSAAIALAIIAENSKVLNIDPAKNRSKIPVVLLSDVRPSVRIFEQSLNIENFFTFHEPSEIVWSRQLRQFYKDLILSSANSFSRRDYVSERVSRTAGYLQIWPIERFLELSDMSAKSAKFARTAGIVPVLLQGQYLSGYITAELEKSDDSRSMNAIDIALQSPMGDVNRSTAIFCCQVGYLPIIPSDTDEASELLTIGLSLIYPDIIERLITGGVEFVPENFHGWDRIHDGNSKIVDRARRMLALMHKLNGRGGIPRCYSTMMKAYCGLPIGEEDREWLEADRRIYGDELVFDTRYNILFIKVQMSHPDFDPAELEQFEEIYPRKELALKYAPKKLMEAFSTDENWKPSIIEIGCIYGILPTLVDSLIGKTQAHHPPKATEKLEIRIREYYERLRR